MNEEEARRKLVEIMSYDDRKKIVRAIAKLIRDEEKKVERLDRLRKIKR